MESLEAIGIYVLQSLSGDDVIVYCERCGQHLAGAADRDLLEHDMVQEVVRRHVARRCEPEYDA